MKEWKKVKENDDEIRYRNVKTGRVASSKSSVVRSYRLVVAAYERKK